MPVPCTICHKDLKFPNRKINCEYCGSIHCSTCCVKFNSQHFCMHCHQLQNGNPNLVFLSTLPTKLLLIHMQKMGIKSKGASSKEDLAYAILCHQVDVLKQQLKDAEEEVPSYLKNGQSSRQGATAFSSGHSTEAAHSSSQVGNMTGNVGSSPNDVLAAEVIHHSVMVGVSRHVATPDTRDIATQTYESQLGHATSEMKLPGQTDSPWGSRGDLYVEKSFDPSTVPTLNDIDHGDDIKRLTVRQLKTILVRNYVDIKGCVERKELVDRLQRLWESRKLEQVAQDEYVCKICMDAPVDCVFLECGHMVTCVTCGKQMNECPICRQYVIRVVHTFRV